MGIAIKKLDADDQLLDGTAFTIYETENDAKAGTAIKLLDDSAWTETSGSSLKVVGNSDPVTYYKGYIYFSGKVLDDLELPSAAGTTYYFVETTAPAGYELLNTVHALKTGTTTTITNIKSPSFTLPITGGSGTMLFTVAGILLIGGSVTLLLVSRRKKKTK